MATGSSKNRRESIQNERKTKAGKERLDRLHGTQVLARSHRTGPISPSELRLTLFIILTGRTDRTDRQRRMDVTTSQERKIRCCHRGDSVYLTHSRTSPPHIADIAHIAHIASHRHPHIAAHIAHIADIADIAGIAAAAKYTLSPPV